MDIRHANILPNHTATPLNQNQTTTKGMETRAGGGLVLGFIVALWGRWALAGDVGTGTDVDGFCSADRLDFRGIVVSALVGSGEAHPCIVF